MNGDEDFCHRVVGLLSDDRQAVLDRLFDLLQVHPLAHKQSLG